MGGSEVKMRVELSKRMFLGVAESGNGMDLIG